MSTSKQATNSDMVAAATALLTDGSATVPCASLKRDVVCRPAKMRQLTFLISMFDRLVQQLDAEALGAIVEMVADAQRSQLDAGGDPNNLPYAGLTATEIVDKAKGRVQIVALLMNALLAELPAILSEFTDVTVAEYDELGLDEGPAIMLAVFTVNYSFFTQSLPRTFSAFMQTWASKNPEKSAALKAVVKRTLPRR